MHYLLIKIQLLWAKHTKWLDRNPVKVPVSKRVIAYAIDWAVGGIISGFPAVLFYGGVTGRSDMFSDYVLLWLLFIIFIFLIRNIQDKHSQNIG